MVERDILKKLSSSAPKFFRAKPEELKEFQKQSPESFGKNGELLITKELVNFMVTHAKGGVPKIGKDGSPELNSNGGIKLIPTSPITIQKRITKDIKNLFLRSPGRLAEINKLVEGSGLINPNTNEPFYGPTYLSSLFKARTTQKIGANTEVGTEVPAKELSEDLIYEEELFEADGESDEKFSFNDILSIAKATAEHKTKTELQEVRNIIKSVLKSYIK